MSSPEVVDARNLLDRRGPRAGFDYQGIGRLIRRRDVVTGAAGSRFAPRARPCRPR